MLQFYCTLDGRATLNIAFGASLDWLWYPIVGSITFLPSCFANAFSVGQCVPFPLLFFHCYRMSIPWITLRAEQ